MPTSNPIPVILSILQKRRAHPQPYQNQFTVPETAEINAFQ